MRFPLDPVATRLLTVVVWEMVKIIVFGAPTVTVAHVEAPLNVTAPVPPPVMERLLNTGLPTGGAKLRVLPVALVSEITRVLVPAVSV